jgi:hypothetical protein
MLGGIVGVYYFYIQANSAYLDARNERVLNRLRENMVDRNLIYKENVRTSTAEILSDLRIKVQALINERMEADFQMREEQRKVEDQRKAEVAQKGDFNPAQARQVQEARMIAQTRGEKPPRLADPNKIKIFPNERLFRIQESANLPIQSITFAEFEKRFSEQINLSFSLTPYESTASGSAREAALQEQTRLLPRDSVSPYNDYAVSYRLITKLSDLSGGQAYEVRLTLDMQTFMDPLLRTDVFDHFVILRDTSGNGQQRPSNVVFTTLQDKRVALAVQRVLPRMAVLNPDSSSLEALERLPYRLYSQSMQFQREELVICGLVSDEHFNQQRQRVSTVLVLLLTILVFMVLLGFPILKMALMGRYERMKLSDLLLSSVTAVLGTSLIGLLLVDFYGYNGPDRLQRQRQVLRLSDQIEQGMLRDITQLNAQLKAYDSLEICDRVMRGNVLSAPDSTGLKPRHFPFFKEVFWVTPDKRLARQWSTGSADVPLVNIAGRSYYEDLMAGRGWQVPGDTTKLERFTLASIRTRINGELTAVVARRSLRSIVPEAYSPGAKQDTLRGADCRDRSDLIPCDIVMASADLPSVVRPVLPPGFGFAVIDESGKVLFHADPNRNLLENFLEEVNLPALQAAMYSRSPLYDRGTYLGEEHDFFLQPVGQLPIFLVTFHQRNYYQITHAQIISLTFLLTLATFFAGLLFVSIVVLFSPRNPVIKHDQFAFDWLRPFHRHRRRYRELVANNLYTLVLAGIFTANSVHPLFAISIIATSYVFTFLLVFLRLNKNAHQQFMWSEYQRIAWLVIALLLAGNLAMYAALERSDFHMVLLYELLQGIILLGVIGRIFADSRANGTGWVRRLYDQYAAATARTQARIPWLGRLLDGLWQVLDAQRSYRLFLATWLLILGVFPVVKFYEIAYNRETRLQVRFAQIQMAKDVTARMETLQARYRYLPQSDTMVRAFLAVNSYTTSYFRTRLGLAPIPKFQPDSLLLLAPKIADSLRRADHLRNTRFFTLPDTLEAVILPPGYRPYDSLLSAIRPRYDELTLRTKQIGDLGSANQQWIWQEGRPKNHDRQGVNEQRWLYFFHDDGFRLSSELPYYHFPILSYHSLVVEPNATLMIFWILLGLFLVLIYALVRFMIHQLFGRAALRIPASDPIVAKRTLLDSEECIFLMVPLRAVEQDYLSVIDIKVVDTQATHYLPTPDRHHYYFRLNEDKDLTRLRALIDRSPSPLDPGAALGFRPEGPTGQPEAESEAPTNVDFFQQGTYVLQDLPLLVLDDFEYLYDTAEACEARINLVEEILDYGTQVVIISIQEPTAIQESYATIMTGGDAPEHEAERMRHLQRMGRLMSNFSKIDYPMERWTIFDYSEEALQFIQGRHVFLHVASALVFSSNRGSLRTLQVEVEGRMTPTIRKTGPDTNTLAIDETYNDVLLDDRLETIHRWLDFDRDRPMAHQITVVSTITPLQIEEIYRHSGCEEEELRSKLRAWRRVLSLFYKGMVSDDPRRIPPEERVADLIRRECVHGPFLQSIQDELLDQLNDYGHAEKGDRELKEEVILRIENRAHLYYQSLWAACNKEERYLIFDLAQDGLINASNLIGLTSLIRKGIVIQTPDTLTVMNKSFRNFVLTVVQPVDALRMEMEFESQDLWRRLRAPISVILFALGAFVFYTQRGILNETLAFVTGAAALIPTLSRVFEAVTTINILPLTGMFRRKKKEEGG